MSFRLSFGAFVGFTLIISFSSFAQTIETLHHKVDSVVTVAISQKAFPGCVVMVVHKNEVVLHKPYGHLTYDSLVPTTRDVLYDLASVTKAAASILALMKLYEDGKIRLDDPLGKYVSGLKNPLKKRTLRDLMAHQAGLPPGISFHNKIRARDGFMKKSVSVAASDEYPFPITDSLFAHRDIYNLMKSFVRKVEIKPTGNFVYSDLFFLMVPELVKRASGQEFENYLAEKFYHPLGADSLLFNPVGKIALEKIAPTEIDLKFRKSLVHGRVHDESAALMGGVAGHAGLFGTSSDLAKIWLMLLNDGTLDGVRYLKPETINLFSSVQNPQGGNRRGLGFDKPWLEYAPASHVAPEASIRSYGHLGFTGIMVWTDPDVDLLFIFLSNRVHPSREPDMLRELRVRAVLHGLAYGVGE
jgi:serine-type D-Ala-D-Ala carboxypeptidase